MTTALADNLSDHGEARAVAAPRRALALAVLVGALGGFAAASLVGRSSAAVAPAVRAAPHDAAAWLALARRADAPGADPGVQGALAQALAHDAALFDAIVDELGRTADRPFRATLRELVAASGRPDVAQAATRLAQGPHALQRGVGFELLARLRPTEPAYALALQGVREETDPVALAGALVALRPPGVPSNADTADMLPRFAALAHHADALVRAHAIQQLADWDKTGDAAAPVVTAALSDADRVVREAAVGAVMIGGLRSDPLKDALLREIGNAAEDPGIRGSALQALTRFVLSDAEQARYRAAAQRLERIFGSRDEVKP